MQDNADLGSAPSIAPNPTLLAVEKGMLFSNIAFLLGSYALAQGSMFIAQTWLVLQGELGFVGHFGAAFAFASFACLIVDWEGLVLLAHRELSRGSDEETGYLFWSLSIFRLLLAAAGVAAIAIWVIGGGFGFAEAYTVAAAPSLLAAALNPGGVLDGLRKSGVTGITAVLPALFSAAALIPSSGLTDIEQGYTLGAAFAGGTILSVILQHVAVRRAGRTLPFSTPRTNDVLEAARGGGALMVTAFPSYIFYRSQIAISVWLLSPAATGLFIYAKQIANAALQCVYFSRRAEFSRLITTVRLGLKPGEVLRAQQWSVGVACLAGAAVTIGGILGALFLDSDIGAAALLAAAFGPMLIAAGLYSAMRQAYVVTGRVKHAAYVSNISVFTALFLSIPAARFLGTFGFALVEFCMNAAAFAALLLLARSMRPASPPDLPSEILPEA